MRVSANTGDAGQGEALLRADNMNDAFKHDQEMSTTIKPSRSWLTLTAVLHAKVSQTELLHVVFQCSALISRVWFGDEILDGDEVLA